MATIEATVTVLDARRCALGEGPVWVPATETLWWIDIDGRKVPPSDLPLLRPALTPQILGLHIPTQRQYEFVWEDPVGSVAAWAGAEGRYLLVASAGGLSRLDLGTGQRRLLLARTALEAQPGNRFNDGKVDAQGRFWVGTMAREGAGGPNRGRGKLYLVQGEQAGQEDAPRLHAHAVLEPVSISNGLAWSADGRTLYYVDSPERSIVAFDLSQPAFASSHPPRLPPARLLVRLAPTDLPDAVFDGMCIDAAGCLWVALWDGACVRRYSPEGVLLGVLPIAAPKVTSCCFGSDPHTLYVTTAAQGDEAKHPGAGLTYKVALKTPCPAPALPSFKLTQ